MPYIKLKRPHDANGEPYYYQHKCITCGKLEEQYSKTNELPKGQSDECSECFYKHPDIQI